MKRSLRLSFALLLALSPAPVARTLAIEDPARGLRATFDATGLRLQPVEGGWTFRLGAATLGRAGSPSAAAAPASAPRLEGARVVFDHPLGREWYEPAAAGIEQSFLIPERPPGQGLLEIGMEARGLDLACRSVGKVAFRADDVRVLELGAIVVRDDAGSFLSARFGGDGARVTIEIDDRGARYPILVDPLFAPPPPIPVPGTWSTNGSVNAIVPGVAGVVYVGGSFSKVGVNSGGGASVSATTGAPDVTIPTIGGAVTAVSDDGAGGWFIGGTFMSVGSTTRHHIAHLLPGGALDLTWNPDADAPLRGLARDG
ncbi:MAG: hypothetical protein HY293_18720, partial [Planctomycetes bacterium]|nr:hypothetical protein [Planctomycetota bacterium]